MFLYIPNGYYTHGVRITPGIWTEDSLSNRYSEILDSGRGYLVNETGAPAQDEKPAVIPQGSMINVLRRQYLHLTGELSSRDMDSASLITRILQAQQPDTVPEPSLDDLRTQYEALAGKRVFYGWDAETLQSKIKDLSDGD